MKFKVYIEHTASTLYSRTVEAPDRAAATRMAQHTLETTDDVWLREWEEQPNGSTDEVRDELTHADEPCAGDFLATSELCTQCGLTLDEHDTTDNPEGEQP